MNEFSNPATNARPPRRDGRPPKPRGNKQPPTARAIALEALRRVDHDGAFANLVLPDMLASIEAPSSGYAVIDNREKAFATELLYGTVRMRRACDWLVRQHLERDPDPETERVLHMGAYQLVFLRTPPHAALSQMVGEAPDWSRGFVNAVLRKVAALVEGEQGIVWPNVATELSYPDWIVETLEDELGEESAHTALRAMNEPAIVHRRSDGYVQDPASQMVVSFLEVADGDRVLDLCAAPGGKATALAGMGALVTAVDVYAHRCALISSNAESLGLRDRIEIHCADATNLPEPLATGAFDAVLLDAPCSGLGSLRRRPDARWRMSEDDVDDLVVLQQDLLRSAAAAVRVGGVILYSVCTLTNLESVDHEAWMSRELPMLEILPIEANGPWVANAGGVRILPGETDGMSVLRFRRTS
jgi:16S rRNA (cytosine967-C5)-methyltransferase